MFYTIAKARSRTATRELEAALRRFENPVARAFLEAARAIRNQSSLRAIARAIEGGDLEEAIRVVGAEAIGDAMRGAGLDPGTRSVQDVLIDAFRAGGDGGMAQLPRSIAIAASLDLTNPEAVRYLTENIPTMIREVALETQDAVREMVLAGFNEGRPAPEIAREVRTIVGLTRAQSRAIVNFRRQLETGEMGNGQAPWDRRLSATERQQARSYFRQASEGRRADRARINALVERYRDSLINRRAKNIARTEVHRAFIEGQDELWRQAQQRRLFDDSEVRRVWIVTPDDRLRPSHRAIPGMNKGGVPVDGVFQTPFGPVTGPAHAHPDLINCFLPGTEVRGTFVAGLESWYSGDAVELQTVGGNRLAVTPNHPVLTARGLVPANQVSEGDHLVAYRDEVRLDGPGDVDEQDRPARVEEVFQALAAVTGRRSVDRGRLYLHGDEVDIQGDIDQVGADGMFEYAADPVRDLPGVLPEVSEGAGVGIGTLDPCREAVPGASPGGVCGSGLMTYLVDGHPAPLDPLRRGSSPDLDAVLTKESRDRASGDPTVATEIVGRGAGLVCLDQVTRVLRYPFSGHVYDLQSTTGWIVSQSIVSSNCRCTVALEFDAVEDEAQRVRDEPRTATQSEDLREKIISEFQQFRRTDVDLGPEVVDRLNDSGMSLVDLSERIAGPTLTSMTTKEIRLRYRNGNLMISRTLDEDGGIVRSLNFKTGVVDHTELRVPTSLQGTGVGKETLRSAFDTYQKLGMKKVELYANIDVGGYAWAKYGFTPTQFAWEDLRKTLKVRVSELGLPVEVSGPISKLLSSKDPRTIWAVADIGIDSGDGVPVGKRLLLGKEWKGEFDLGDESALERFNAYVS